MDNKNISDTQTLVRAIESWRSTGSSEIDHGILKLLQSGFFKQYQMFTEQVVFLMDHATMKYLYVSENVEALFELSYAEVLEGGLRSVQHRIHPDDIDKLATLSALINDKLKALAEAEILECRLTYDYRFLTGANNYRRFWQHSIPLTVDNNRNIGHALIILSDISAYKKDEYSGYKIVQHGKNGLHVTLLEGIVGGNRSHALSKREVEIIQLTSQGLTEKEIARDLFLSTHTVKTHRKNILRKTGVKNSIELVRYAAAHLLI